MHITLPVVDRVIMDADSFARKSHDHGERHWRQVAQIGWYIAEQNPAVNLEALFWFALLHDSKRQSDYSDPEHGARAATRLDRLWERGVVRLDADTVALVHYALVFHNDGTTISHPLISACWDADRLSLWRVGIKPDPKFMTHPWSQRPETIEWARDLWSPFMLPPIMPWADLLSAYNMLERRREMRMAA